MAIVAGTDFSDQGSMAVRAAESRLRAQARHLRGAARRRVQTKVLVGRPAAALLSFPGVRQPALVVGTHHHRGIAWLASVASGTIHMGRTAVAVVPNVAGSDRRSSRAGHAP
jgi:nucleotide-binding universal stress UspA family protein